MSFLLIPFQWLYAEFGLGSVYATGQDAWLVIAARCLRMFAYGANSLIIALFFSALHFSDSQIGLFFTLTLLGDVLLSVFLTLVADRVGRRRILLAGAVLMVASGAVFAVFENFWILLLAAVVGVISATGGDFGPFRAVEESILSHLTTPETRADVLAWYVTTSSLGSALGTELSGRAVEFFHAREGWTMIDAYHVIFWLYVIMGTVNMIAALFLSDKCEVAEERPPEQRETEPLLVDESLSRIEVVADADDDEDHHHHHHHSQDHLNPAAPVAKPETAPPPRKKSRFAQISSTTRSVMYKLWFLLTVDSLADGMVSASLTTYYLDRKFHLPKSRLGDIFSTCYLLTTVSSVFAGPLARHLGLVKTMVFTHIPSSAAVLLFPIPRGVALTVTLLFIRTGLNNMDQAPRVALIAAVVQPDERTAVMGITSMLRTLASAAGPSVTGFLAGNGRFWIAFVVAGSLRLAYDLGLFAMFVNMKLYAHEEEGEEDKQEDDEDADAAAAAAAVAASRVPAPDRGPTRRPDEEER